MSDKEEFEYSGKISAEEVADYLNQIAEGFRSKLLKLQGRGQIISIVPADVLKIEVRAERKDSKGKMELELSWKEKYTSSDEKLEISSGAPEEKAEDKPGAEK